MGRPRTFDEAKALDRAMRLFWRKGYEGTSLSDLTQELGINRPSLYAAFGNKESLFRSAVDLYAAGPGAYIAAAIAQPTARRVVEALFYGTADLVTEKGRPAGCFLINAGVRCGSESAGIERSVKDQRNQVRVALTKRFERARKDGDLPRAAKPADLARWAWTVVNGMAIETADGASRSELRRIADQALRGWR